MSLHLRDLGQGEAVLLLHSGGMTGDEWAPQLPTLSGRFRVLAPDQPGHGASPMQAPRLRIADMARAMLDLLDGLGIERAHWVGSSMGGAVALWAALNAPERVDRLVLYRVAHRKDAATHQETRALANPDYWRRVGMEGWMRRAHRAQGGDDAWIEVIGRVADALDPAGSDHRHSLDDLARIAQPTLVVVGDRDPLVPVDVALAMYRALPAGSLWVMPMASHVTATNTWRSDIFSSEIIRFFSQRPAGR